MTLTLVSFWLPVLRSQFHLHPTAGHKDAYEKCGILHRDVSGANILILDNGRGILNDWDMSRKVEHMKDHPGKNARIVSHFVLHLCH